MKEIKKEEILKTFEDYCDYNIECNFSETFPLLYITVFNNFMENNDENKRIDILSTYVNTIAEFYKIKNEKKPIYNIIFGPKYCWNTLKDYYIALGGLTDNNGIPLMPKDGLIEGRDFEYIHIDLEDFFERNMDINGNYVIQILHKYIVSTDTKQIADKITKEAIEYVAYDYDHELKINHFTKSLEICDNVTQVFMSNVIKVLEEKIIQNNGKIHDLKN